MTPLDRELIITLLSAFVIFLVLREFTTWYFKINERTKLLHSIDSSLKLLLAEYRESNEDLEEEFEED